jgi:hypothetical protein
MWETTMHQLRVRIHVCLALFSAIAISAVSSGCGGAGESADGVAHLHEAFGEARVEAAAVPDGLPSTVEWAFESADAAGSWQPLRPWNPTVAPAELALGDGAVRVTLTDRTANLNGFLVGGIYASLEPAHSGGWSAAEVEVRAFGPLAGVTIGQNLRTGSGQADDAPWPFESWGGTANAEPGDGNQVLRTQLFVPDGAEWRELGLWFGAPEPTTIEVISVRLIPRESRFADAAAGVLAVGPAPNAPSADAVEVPSSALYMWAPGRAEYSVQVPDNGRLDLALGVVRGNAPVTFRVSATPAGGEPDVVLEAVVSDPWEFSARHVNLAHLAGQTVDLTLEAEPAAAAKRGAQPPPNIALWRDLNLYTPGRLAVEIVDAATGDRTPVRIRLTDAEGATAPVPAAAIGIQYGANDVAAGYQLLPDSSFYVDGAFDSELQPGEYRIHVTKGYEYLDQEIELTVGPGEDVARSIQLERWIDMPARGWYSADDHIHLRRSPRENPLILKWVAAEDIHVGALLQMGDFWTTYFSQYAWGRDGAYQFEDYMLTSGQEEPRTHEIGHTISLAADDFVRYRGEYYHYDRVFDHVHALGGVSGYAHKGVGFHGYRGLTLDVLREKVDFIEVLQFCGAPALVVDQYYHFLELGFELTALAGSDFPFCGRTNRIGDARFYTYLGDDFSFESWRGALQAGHTFVSSGPMIEFTVNGTRPGDRLDVTGGEVLQIRARAFGHAEQVPLTKLEIVAHGEVIASAEPDDDGGSTVELAIELELPAELGVWIAARAEAGPEQAAHTTPVYVSVDGSGFHNPATALGLLDLNEQYLDELEAEIAQPNESVNQHAWRYREGLEDRIAETRAVIARLRQQFAEGR